MYDRFHEIRRRIRPLDSAERLDQQAAVVHVVDLPADRHGRDAEKLGQFLIGARAGLLDPSENSLLPCLEHFHLRSRGGWRGRGIAPRFMVATLSPRNRYVEKFSHL